MTLSGTPGPGGFGSAPPFGQPHPGLHLTPARARPHPGLHNGSSTATGGHPWLWVAVAVIAVLVLVATIALVRARSRAKPDSGRA